MKLDRRQYLVLLTPLTYLASYAYLAWYHNELFIWDTIVHESGKLTLYQTTFYTSHFLGHLLVYLVVSLLFVGYYLTMSQQPARSSKAWRMPAVCVVLVLLFAFVHSEIEFGHESTWNYLTQKMQDENNNFPGNGSWNLHLLSTITMVFTIPFYLALVLTFMRKKIVLKGEGAGFITAAVLLIVVITTIINGDFFSTLIDLGTDNRHLAHSVREIATFGLTYFPLTLVVIQPHLSAGDHKPSLTLLLITFIVALGPVLYQVIMPLQEGIDNLAQAPSFTKGEGLGITYLLASHFFEHFVDSLFFLSLSLFWLYVFKRKTA